MIEALKKLDKKFLIMAGCIILCPIIIIIFLAIIQSCSGGVDTHEKYEQKMISAAQKYIKKNEKEPTKESETITIKLSDLVSGGYIKSTEKALDDSTCSGEVIVRRNGSSIETNEGGFLNYVVNLTCDNYKTVKLVDKITENIVTSESGLYKIGDEYVFKGDQVKNYILIDDVSYRIMSIDKDGIMKLTKSESENTSRIWDNKYNTEVNRSYGKTIYKDSAILTYLLNDYTNPKKINKKTKKHIVAYDVCIGKRSVTDYSISKDLDCSEKLENQVISLMNVSDFAMASSDPECNSTVSKSCRNYNYLSKFAVSTWTLNSAIENTYEVFYISDGVSGYDRASIYNSYNYVIYVDGNELYTSGEGTLTNPYIISDNK